MKLDEGSKQRSNINTPIHSLFNIHIPTALLEYKHIATSSILVVFILCMPACMSITVPQYIIRNIMINQKSFILLQNEYKVCITLHKKFVWKLYLSEFLNLYFFYSSINFNSFIKNKTSSFSSFQRIHQK